MKLARMHSRKKGKSGSRRPASKTAPSWAQADKQEVSELVLKMAREGFDEAAIGRMLRDGHGVPSVRNLTGKTVTQILEENALLKGFPRDLLDLIRKAVRVRKHLRAGKQDKYNATMLRRTESKIKRLVKYYRGKKLPADWKYEPEQAALLVK